jgi:peroxiredoxin
MSLQDQLSQRIEAALQDDAYKAAYDQVITTLRDNGFLPNIIAVGDRFPDFMLPDSSGGLVDLTSLLARAPLIIQFFRGEWCPYCRMMLDCLSDSLPELIAAGGTLVALTPDTHGLPLDAKIAHNADFIVLSDVDYGVGLAAGVIFRLPPLYRSRLSLAGIDLAERHGNAAWFLPVPATFVLDGDGIVRWRFADADFTKRAEPSEVIKIVRALKNGTLE